MTDLSELGPGNELMELCRVQPASVFCEPIAVGRKAEGNDRLATRGLSQLGIPSEVANQYDFVNAPHEMGR